ncbi:DUF397 domain-containing protein [Streptomyces alboflavus]|uniref:DUF397 domain-containing protein n=1 Tax=Streptomyces alboflavus TaxID=67267 RepID=UPI003691CB97
MTDPNWRKSTYSENATNDCIEVADNQPLILIRDTKDHAAGLIEVTPAAWAVFTGHVSRN